MGRGFFEITPELLESVLLFPEGMRILNIRKCDKIENSERDVYHVVVEDEHIFNTKPRTEMPRVMLEYESRYDYDGKKIDTILSGWTTKRD